jgi:hypothetical protein
MKMIENDQYGLEIEMLLCDMATKENFSMIEKAVVERILSLSGESNTFQRECMLDLLVDLYEKCENPSAVVDTLISLGLRDEQDYRRIADVLSSEGDNRKAFSYVREGLSAGGSESSELHKLYFTLLPHVLDEEDVEVEEALAVALELISDKIFNPQEYMDIKGVFEEWGRYEVLISGIKEKCDDNRVVDVLLFEDRIDELIDLVSSSDSLEPKKLMKIAYAVKEEGNHECSLNLVHRALKSQFLFPYPLAEKMISFFVKEADIGMIEDVMNEIPFAVENCFATALLSRNQEYAMKMLRNLVYTSDREEVRGYIALLETQYAVELGQLWIEHVVSRSRYDDAVEMLGLLKDKMEKKEWESYISTFKETHSRKRTLLAKMEEL